MLEFGRVQPESKRHISIEYTELVTHVIELLFLSLVNEVNQR